MIPKRLLPWIDEKKLYFSLLSGNPSAINLLANAFAIKKSR
jgi:hypothetical protein